MEILQFSTPDCTWCKVVTPHIEAYANEHGVKLFHVDAIKDKKLADAYGIQTAPVMIFEEGGNVLAKAVGYAEIMKLLNE